MKFKIHCLDNGMEYTYIGNNIWDAVDSHIYYIKLNNANIKHSVSQSENGIHLMINGLTYWIRKK